MKIAKEMNEDVFAKNPLCYGGAINQGRKNLDVEIGRVKKKDGRGRGVLPDPAGIHEGGRGETAPDQGGDGRDNPLRDHAADQQKKCHVHEKMRSQAST